MKYILIILMLSFNSAFSQLIKTETDTPTKNSVEVAGEFQASTNIYRNFVDVTFYDRRTDSTVTFAVSNKEYKQLTDLLTNYNSKDGDYYQMNVKGGVLSIRYEESYGYLQAHLNLRTGEGFYFFPTLNRNQFKVLFK